MPDITKKRKNGHGGHHPENPALVRAELVRTRHRFEEAADAVRQDLDAIRSLAQWRGVLTSRPLIVLGIGVAAGLLLGFWVGSRSDR